MSRMAWGFLLAALLFAPVASASEEEGAFLIAGTLTFVDGMKGDGAPLAFFVSQTANLSEFKLHSHKLTVTETRFPFRGVDPLISDPIFIQAGQVETREWTVTDATVSLVPGDHRGILGIHTVPSASVVVQADGEASWESRTFSEVGEKNSASTSGPASMYYAERVSGPHLSGFGNGSVVYAGGGALRLVGPDVEIQSSDVTHHRTGIAQGTPTDRTITVLFLHFEAPATVTLADVPFEAAVSALEAAWDGNLRFTPREGSFQTSDRIYFPTGRMVVLDGQFKAYLASMGAEKARINLSGDLRSTSLSYVPVSDTFGKGGSSPHVFTIVVAVAIGAGGGAMVMWGLTRKSPFASRLTRLPFTVEDCLEAATTACGEEDWGEAAMWYERTLRLAPTSARIRADLAFCIAQLGKEERALTLYAEAHELSPDGEIAFNAADLALRMGRMNEAEKWIVAALERSPDCVLQLDEEWDVLMERPGPQKAAEIARSRLDADSEP